MYPEPFHPANRGLSPRKARRKEPTEFSFSPPSLFLLIPQRKLQAEQGLCMRGGTAALQFLRVPSAGCSAGKEENRPETTALPALGRPSQGRLHSEGLLGSGNFFPLEKSLRLLLGSALHLPPQSVGDLSVQFTPVLFSGGFKPLPCVLCTDREDKALTSKLFGVVHGFCNRVGDRGSHVRSGSLCPAFKPGSGS